MDVKSINRERCTVLTLTLEKKWFDMIGSGEKKQEYRTSEKVLRQIERWYGHSLIRGKMMVVKLCLGYQKKRREMTFTTGRPFWSYSSAFPKWGEPDSPHYVIPLLDRVMLV